MASRCLLQAHICHDFNIFYTTTAYSILDFYGETNKTEFILFNGKYCMVKWVSARLCVPTI